jgi:hypothetical protein
MRCSKDVEALGDVLEVPGEAEEVDGVAGATVWRGPNRRSDAPLPVGMGATTNSRPAFRSAAAVSNARRSALARRVACVREPPLPIEVVHGDEPARPAEVARHPVVAAGPDEGVDGLLDLEAPAVGPGVEEPADLDVVGNGSHAAGRRG